MAKPPTAGPPAKAKPPAPTTRKQHARVIAKAWNTAAEGFLEVGRCLVAARSALEEQPFKDMCEKELPFSRSTAYRLIAIAEDPRIGRVAHGLQLPGSWRTQYQLTRLPDDVFSAALEAGEITPDTTRADVGRIRLAAEAGRAAVEASSFPTRTYMTMADLEALAAEVDAGAVKPFKVVYADPPWPFETWSAKGGARSPEAHYATMTIQELLAMGGLVERLAAENCVLFLWGVNWSFEEVDIETPHGKFPGILVPGVRVPSAFVVMKAWGFDTVTKGFCWVKRHAEGGGIVAEAEILNAGGHPIGQGKWTRGNPEDCWLGVRGKPKCLSHKVNQLLVADRHRHSAKPPAIHGLIGELVRGPYLELFGRRERKGWTVWGDEIAKPGGGAEAKPAGGAEVPAAVVSRDEKEDLTDIPEFLRREA
mgnify:CR=1 FL=1